MNITVFGTPTCPHCVAVKSFLQSRSVEFEYKTVGLDIQKEELKALVQRDVKTVPVIIVDEKEVTFNELRTMVALAQKGS